MTKVLGRAATFIFLSIGMLGSAMAAPMSYTYDFSFGSPISGIGVGTEPGLTGSVSFTYDTDLLPTSGFVLQEIAPVDSIDVTLLGQTYTPSNTQVLYNIGGEYIQIETTDAHLGSTLGGYFFQIFLRPAIGDNIFVDGPTAAGPFFGFGCLGSELVYGRPSSAFASISCGPGDSFALSVEDPESGGGPVASGVPTPGAIALLGFGLLAIGRRRQTA